MLLNLKHKDLEVYQSTRSLIKEVFNLSMSLPAEEKFNMVQQIRRAALPVKLNIANGSSRKSEKDRKLCFEITSDSLVEIDAALDTAVDLAYLSAGQPENAATLLNKCFAMLSKTIN